MIYVIIGMHKSGTTLISQVLHKSGINMGNFDEELGYDKGNQYERIESRDINLKLLKCHHKSSINTNHPVYNYANNIQYGYEIKKLINNLNSFYINWGFKDPRTCLTYNIWNKYLPEHKLICIFRHPHEVFNHYQRNISNFNILKKIHIGFKTLKTWYIYNNEIIKIIKHNQYNYLILDYNKIISSNYYFSRLNKFLATETFDCRSNKLYRARYSNAMLYKHLVFLMKFFLNLDIERQYTILKSLD